MRPRALAEHSRFGSLRSPDIARFWLLDRIWPSVVAADSRSCDLLGVSRPKTEPRKRPKQSRSRVLYDSLVEATKRLLASEGVAAVTTARVAELAGVSIGSLYQYFPSREALIAAVIDHRLEADLQELMPMLEGLRAVELDEAIRGLIEVVVRYYRDETSLYREMVAAMPEVDREMHVRRVLEGFDKVIVVVLDPHRRQLGEDVERCAWIMRTTLIRCVREAAASHPDAFADGFLTDRLEAMCRALLGCGG